MAQTLTVNDHSKSVTNAAGGTLIIPKNEKRKWFVIVNAGAVAVYLKLDAVPTANNGIFLTANGGSWFQDMATAPFYGEVRGIAIGGACNVTATEVQERI